MMTLHILWGLILENCNIREFWTAGVYLRRHGTAPYSTDILYAPYSYGIRYDAEILNAFDNRLRSRLSLTHHSDKCSRWAE